MKIIMNSVAVQYKVLLILSDIAPKDYENRCSCENYRTKLVRQEIDFKPCEQRDNRHRIEHQKRYSVDGLRNSVVVINVGYHCDQNTDEYQCCTLIDPFHGDDPLVVHRYVTELPNNGFGWE